MKESWKRIPSAPNYEVSDFGNVRSFYRIKPYLLKPQPHKQGYLQVSIVVDGKRRTRTIHTLVMEAFVGSPPIGMCVRHKDDDCSNNALTNLEYGTHTDNMRDKHKSGTNAFALTERKVRIIRGLKKCGFTYTRLSEIFSVSTTCIYRVIRRRTWVHVD